MVIAVKDGGKAPWLIQLYVPERIFFASITVNFNNRGSKTSIVGN